MAGRQEAGVSGRHAREMRAHARQRHACHCPLVWQGIVLWRRGNGEGGRATRRSHGNAEYWQHASRPGARSARRWGQVRSGVR